MKRFSAQCAETEPEIKEGLQLDLRHRATRAEFKEGRAQFDIELDMDALGDKDPAKKLFHVDCCFELEYLLKPGYLPTGEELEAFKKGNAIFHCWPYVREFVQNATQRLGLAVPPIPLLRLQPVRPMRKAGRKVPQAEAARQP